MSKNIFFICEGPFISDELFENLKLKKNLKLNKIIKKRKTFLITTEENKIKTNVFKKKGYRIMIIKSLNNKKNFIYLFQQIYKLGYSRVFFECGLTFLNTLLNYKLLNNLYILQNKKKLGKNGFNNNHTKYLKKIRLKKKVKVNLNDDTLYQIKF